MRTPTLNIKIGDSKWKVKLLSINQYEDQLGNDSEALTDTSSHIIYFRMDIINDCCVRHELFHAYFTLAHVDSATGMSKDDVEEVVASLIGKHGESLVVNSKKVLTWLKKEGKKYEEVES